MNNSLTHLEDLDAFSHLELLASQVVEGFITGLHKSPYHGFSVEFAEHRLYNVGESTRNMDWKVYARTGKLYTKRYDEETNLRCQLIIDVSSSMYFPSDSANNKIRFSFLAAAAIMQLMKKQRDAFGLSLFSDNIEIHTQNKSTYSHQKLLLSYLENYLHTQEKQKKTATASTLHQIAETIHKRSLIIIFSDMLDNPDNLNNMFEALQHLKYNKHEVVLFHVVHKKNELDFAFENRPYKFVDLETGETIKLQPNQIKQQYVDSIHAYYNQIRLKCSQYKIDWIEADIQHTYNDILLAYLLKRKKMF